MSVTGFICGFSGVLLYHMTYMIYLTSILVQKKSKKKKKSHQFLPTITVIFR